MFHIKNIVLLQKMMLAHTSKSHNFIPRVKFFHLLHHQFRQLNNNESSPTYFWHCYVVVRNRYTQRLLQKSSHLTSPTKTSSYRPWPSLIDMTVAFSKKVLVEAISQSLQVIQSSTLIFYSHYLQDISPKIFYAENQIYLFSCWKALDSHQYSNYL